MEKIHKWYFIIGAYYLLGLAIWEAKGFKLASIYFLFPLLAFFILNSTCLISYLLPCIFYLPDYKLMGGFSYKVILITVSTIVVISKRMYRKQSVFPPSFIYLMTPFFLFIVWVGVASLRHYNGFNPEFFRYNYINLFPKAMVVYLLSVCINDWNKLKVLSLIIMSVGIWLSIISFREIGGFSHVFQYLNPELQLFRVKSTLIRARTLFSIPVAYSYTIMIIFVFAFGVFLRCKQICSIFYRLVAALTSIISLAGLSTAITRSSNIGALVGVLTLVFLPKSKNLRLNHMVKILVIFLIVTPILSIVGNYFYNYLQDPNIIGRYTLFLSGLKIAFQHPLWGVGPLHYSREAFQFALEAEGLPYLATAVQTTSHNQFTLIFSFYGLPGLTLLLWFTFRLFNMTAKVVLSSVQKGWSWGIILLSLFSALLFTSGFHNSGFFITHDVLIWVFISLPIILLNLPEPVIEKGKK